MAKLKPGDSVICRLRDDRIVNLYDEKWDKKEVLDIISIYDEGYFALIPSRFFIHDSILITDTNAKKFNINKKFIDSNAIYLNEFKIAGVHSRLDGMACCKCNCFYGMASSNQDDGTLICFSCKTYPYYKSRIDR